ncbi:helix-turn-helix transcriptional regulator [Pseudodonghicola flavimaris]|uniref:LuxR C-terminal-related transcriptional regulator n=1 Tax=Pseudodonghicola flavimaris TaxID=3050036 RepID=A0ABT7F1L0_9RHOB|nr:LuxR C-terminal-related transcriptional regulator [Pseudodonghicola flavimaris]MDK3018395.1 LuxR C-terminal-related transcriptional regulator [Pseudodonghicola flavimaris]
MIFSRIDMAEARADTAIADLCEIVQAVGTDRFDDMLDSLLRSRFAIAEVFAARYPRNARGRPVLISSSDDAAARSRAEDYCASFFGDDPLFDMLDTDTPDGFYAIQVAAESVRAPRFRSACFTRPGYCENLTLVRKEGDTLLLLKLFARTANGPFSPAQVSELSQLGTLLLPLLLLHTRLSGEEHRFRQVSAEEMEDCVSWAFPELTRREVAVCARSILGVTAEGIALDLGIKQTSVLTYRRRAYARLNVSSINQLSSMLIQSSAARKLALAS